MITLEKIRKQASASTGNIVFQNMIYNGWTETAPTNKLQMVLDNNAMGGGGMNHNALWVDCERAIL